MLLLGALFLNLYPVTHEKETRINFFLNYTIKILFLGRKYKKTEMRLIIIILITMLVIPASGQRRKKDEGEVVTSYIEGITYALPRTGIRINVKAVKEVFEPGPYSSYASQLLGINNARERASVRWFIEDINVSTFHEPDPGQVYKAFGEGAFNVSLTPDGCLAGINIKQSAGQPQGLKANVFIENPPLNDGFSFDNINDTPIYTAGDSTTNYRPLRVGTEKKAAEAAARILECRLARFHMVAGLLDEFHPDGTAYKVSLEELESIEKDYLSLFTGRITHSTEGFSVDFIPSPTSEKGDVVFRFSDEKGVLPADDLSGKPVVLKAEPEKELIGKYSGQIKSENPQAGESGVFYRMPAPANVSIIYELKTILTSRVLLPQFGPTAPVPEDLLFGDYAIEIHPETGAIKSVTKNK